MSDTDPKPDIFQTVDGGGAPGFYILPGDSSGDDVFPVDFVQLPPSPTIRILGDDGAKAGFVYLGDIASSGVNPALSSLADVNLTGNAIGDTLAFDGSKWVPVAPTSNSFDGGNF